MNLPCGEVYCAPVETEGDGVLVGRGPVGAIGKPAGITRPFVIKRFFAYKIVLS